MNQQNSAKDVKLTDHDSLESLFGVLQEIQDPMLDMPGTMGRFLEMKARRRGVPIHGTFELTPLCNLDCKMCYVHLNKDQMGNRRLLSVEQWKSLMDQAIEAGMMDAVFTGGECLTYPGFDELYLHLQSKGVRTTVLTNGLLLTEERIDFFKKYPPKGIQITLYGSSEDEYEAVTGHRCFERVMTGIRRTAATGIPLSIAITPNRFLFDNGEALVKLAHGLGLWYTINMSLFSPFDDTGRQKDHIDMDIDNYINLHLFRKALSGQPVSPLKEYDLPLPPSAGPTTKGLLCNGGSSSFCISWDGRMKPCSVFSGIEAFPLKESFHASWNRIHAACKEYILPQECINCSYNSICPVCVMIHKKDAPAGHASPALCKRAQKMVISGLIELDKH